MQEIALSTEEVASAQRKREYNRQYRRNNVEKARERSRKHHRKRRENAPEKVREQGREIQRRFRQHNKERIREERYAGWRAWSRRLKEEVLSHYSQGSPACTQCGERDLVCLSLDHLNDDGKTHRAQINALGGQQTYHWAKKHGFPSVFQVLCMNCQFRKEATRRERIIRERRYSAQADFVI